MKVRVLDPAVLVRHVDREVGDHAPGDELFHHKLSCKGDVLLHGKLVLQRNVEAVGELGFFRMLDGLNRVP